MSFHRENPTRRSRAYRAELAIMTALALMSLSAAAVAADDPGTRPAKITQASIDALLRQMQAMERRINSLEGELKQSKAAAPSVAPAPGATVQALPAISSAPAVPGSAPVAQAAPPAAPQTGDKAIFGLMDSPVEGLKFGAYGELKFGSQQNPSNNGQWQNGFDAGRIVLLPTYQFTDRIIFNAEIEFEHAGAGFDADDKLHGTAEIEQAYIDFKISEYFNYRAPGIDLVPIGYTNLYHEPTLFYSVQRPELANGLIPTTWAPPATSIYGKIVDNLNYQFQISSSLEDFGSDFSQRTDANTVPPFPAGYTAGIDGKKALAFSRPPRGDFRQLSNDLAYDLRLSYTPPFIPGLAGSTSIYYTPNVTPRGGYADTGAKLGRSSLALLDSEFRYRIPESGLELRGEAVAAFFGNPANLRANNDSDPTNNVGSSMYGLSGEVAYHVPLGSVLSSEWEAVPFYRYTYENLQTGGFRGSDPNAPIGAGHLQFHTVGVAVFPSPKLALKFNYQKVLDGEPGGAKSDSFLGGVGFFF